MAKAYLVVTYRKITNQEKWQAYAKLAGACIPKMGGKFIIRGMPVKTYEKGMNERVVVVHVDDVGMSGPANRGALAAMADAATCGSVMVPCPAFGEIAELARERPELASLFTSFDPTYPQVKVALDREKARTLGVPVSDVFQALSASMGGRSAA